MEPPLRASTFAQVGTWIKAEIAALYPGSFALVMATGIISNALFASGYRGLSDILFAVVGLAYPSLLLLTVLRLVLFPRTIWADLVNPRLTFSFFTIVAGTSVFALAVNLHGLAGLALALWLFALLVWFTLIFFGFATLIFRNTARDATIIEGGWLIAIVGTESLVILGTVIAPGTAALSSAVFVLIHMLWGAGLALYGIFIVLFVDRLFFFEVRPDDINPQQWLVMGAAAISTNAGSTLVLSVNDMAFLHSLRPFVDGVTLILWIWATWWIPLLLMLGVWKHGVRRVPLTYTPMHWSLVFPLGMYSLATLRLSLAADFPPLLLMSHAMAWIALAAWIMTGVAFLRACWRSYQKFGDSSAAPA